MYDNELRAIKHANLYRSRELYDASLIDMASNDYLGLSEEFDTFDKAVSEVRSYTSHSPKASQLVNGYHPIHQAFENYLLWRNGFEAGMVVGSGFLANLSLIEALPRKGDILILDEEYHASGILASKLLNIPVFFFSHNDASQLENILDQERHKRAIVAVEGIYSMSGDILAREIFQVCEREDVLLIVDEAHSVGVLGSDLLGVFDHYDIPVKKNHIKMGTLGKAMGSYGAYILASCEVIDFLQNRAKAIIYATAPSLFDIALAHQAFLKVEEKQALFVQKRAQMHELAKEIFGVEIEGLILNIPVSDNAKALACKAFAKKEGYMIGAIRQPTVPSPILRIILRLNLDIQEIKVFLLRLKKELS